MNPRKYFIAVFGNPRFPMKDTLESGNYHPDIKYGPFHATPGDILLLYCTESYPGYPKSVPGIGTVVESSGTPIRYDYEALAKPMCRREIIERLEPTDRKKFMNIRFSRYWLFEISSESARHLLPGYVVRKP